MRVFQEVFLAVNGEVDRRQLKAKLRPVVIREGYLWPDDDEAFMLSQPPNGVDAEPIEHAGAVLRFVQVNVTCQPNPRLAAVRALAPKIAALYRPGRQWRGQPFPVNRPPTPREAEEIAHRWLSCWIPPLNVIAWLEMGAPPSAEAVASALESVGVTAKYGMMAIGYHRAPLLVRVSAGDITVDQARAELVAAGLLHEATAS